MDIFFTRPYSFCRLLAYLPGLYLSKKGGLTLWGAFQDLSKDMLVRSCISKSTAMPLFRISLAFQHNSWAKRCRLPHLSSFYTYIGYWNIFPYKMAGTKVPVPCVPPTAAHLITWTFVIYHAAMKMKKPCILQPSHLFPKFHFPFWSTQLPVLIAVSIFGPKPSYIVEPGYVWQVQSH